MLYCLSTTVLAQESQRDMHVGDPSNGVNALTAKVNALQSQIDELKDSLNRTDRIPTGTIVAFYSDTIPNGWMLCNGSKIPAKYEELRKLVGDSVPDLRGMFLRGANNGRNDGKGDIEINRVVKAEQSDMLEEHSHSLIMPEFNPHSDHVAPIARLEASGAPKAIVTTEKTGGGETRPKNVAVNYIIKI